MGKLILIKGTSGVGKSFIANLLVQNRKSIRRHLDWDKIEKSKLIDYTKKLIKENNEVIISEWFYPSYHNVESILKEIELKTHEIIMIELIASLDICLERHRLKPQSFVLNNEYVIKEHYWRSKYVIDDSFSWHKINTKKSIDLIVTEIENLLVSSF